MSFTNTLIPFILLSCFITCIHKFLHSFSLTFCLHPSFMPRVTHSIPATNHIQCVLYWPMGTLLWRTKTPKNVHFCATTVTLDADWAWQDTRLMPCVLLAQSASRVTVRLAICCTFIFFGINSMNSAWKELIVWYKTKFVSQNFGYQIWWPSLSLWHRLPKLVVNISSQFQHLVNTGLDVGSLSNGYQLK